jgi:large subunit ribosomal protein L7/L12
MGADDAAAAGEDAAVAKPKEKTIFTVKLESFDVGSKPKVIKEVKVMVPNLTLIKVRPHPLFLV